MSLITTASLNLGQAALSFYGFSFLFYRRLFIRPANFQFLEQAAFRKFVLQDFQCFFHVIVDYFYFQIYSSLLIVVSDRVTSVNAYSSCPIRPGLADCVRLPAPIG